MTLEDVRKIGNLNIIISFIAGAIFTFLVMYPCESKPETVLNTKALEKSVKKLEKKVEDKKYDLAKAKEFSKKKVAEVKKWDLKQKKDYIDTSVNTLSKIENDSLKISKKAVDSLTLKLVKCEDTEFQLKIADAIISIQDTIIRKKDTLIAEKERGIKNLEDVNKSLKRKGNGNYIKGSLIGVAAGIIIKSFLIK